jgi:formate hydrogenlyase transcriptional activator
LPRSFKKYLAYKSDAHLLLAGHADRRGPEAYNHPLSERRAGLVKQFLVEQGVPEANINKQGFGAENNLTADDVKQLLDQDPDLSAETRQTVMRKLGNIVLAYNRRVDLTLSSTGQESAREYPFNADDFATLDDRFAARKEALKRMGIEYRSLCRLPLRTPHGPLGVFSIASSRPHDYSDEEVRFLCLAADQVALSISHALSRETLRRNQSELEVQSARLKLLGALSNRLMSNLDASELVREVTVGIRRVIPSDFALVGLLESESGRVCVNACDMAEDIMLTKEAVDSLGKMFGAHIFSTGKPWIGNSEEFDEVDAGCDPTCTVAGFRNSCAVPLAGRDRMLGIVALGKHDDAAYTPDEIDFLVQVSRLVAVTVENSLVYGELRKLKDNFSEEQVHLEDEIRSELHFEEIVGRSAALRRVLRQVEVVAPTDSGILIQGETGTGKELIAHAIHNLSSRRDQPFVKLNCAAIPSGLLESELFGHEKGAFTGAIMRKAGRFEVADKGTLFLDEVGDIPLELQPKLLRVLQEREFERLGSTRTQQVDVRVIAATHRDLKKMVEDGQFRSDLFYRLHVFPLPVPPLRDRREDIPILVRHYVDKYARRMNRRIETIPSHAMEVFANYSWPGNVRELQNFIEWAVILSPRSALRPPLAELKKATVPRPSSELTTLKEAEREHVLRAIRESNWVIGGPNGAAARLGMKRTTLGYRIRKLNISVRPQ